MKNDVKFSGYIPIEELDVTYSRSSGPGGQNVNCVDTKVDVRFKVETAKWIPEIVRSRLLEEVSIMNTLWNWMIWKQCGFSA